MERLIFLDIDGVLNYRLYFSNPCRKIIFGKKRHCRETTLCPRNLFWVGLLCKITKAKVVMSSSWRYGWDTETGKVIEEKCIKTNKVLKFFGINISATTDNKIEKLAGEYGIDEECVDHFVDNEAMISHGLGMTRTSFLMYARGSQILDWLERNTYSDKYVILDDDITDIKVYKILSDHIVKSSFYKNFGGFGFKQFIKALKILK